MYTNLSRFAKHFGQKGFLRSPALLLVLLGGTFGVCLRAQDARIHHQITQSLRTPPTMGRDFWWAQPSNYWGIDQGGKYIRIYITSPQNTTAYVSFGGSAATAVSIQAYKIGTFNVPGSWEMESSGVVEPKAIHVWSNDADLTVYVMSHNASSSDGSWIVPTIGWGTDYVVAGYGALYEGFGSYIYDFPSEFTVAANADNTIVQITPACDLRQCLGPGDNPSFVKYPAGKTFQIQLEHGESAEFMSVQAQATENYDVTGTIVHSSNPVGVIGGSGCPNIPAEFAYCDHIEDMMPPVRTWATTYYSTNFIQPPSMPGHDFALYLMIASKPGQTIWRHDYTTGTRVECQLSNPYDIYWDELESAQKFWSDAPFLLVEYINSSTYPDNMNGLGDPAEVIINPREQYTKTVVFQTPSSVGSQSSYDSYASVIVNRADEARTTFDGQSILTYNQASHQPVDDTFDVFTIPHLKPGTHIADGDALGIGVYAYGYGLDESYAWAGSFGTGTFHAEDTIAPRADTSGDCYDAFVLLRDSGMNPGGVPQSKLSSVRLDSDYNMAYVPDTSFVVGLGTPSSSYAMSVVDRTKPAYLKVDAFDVAGNATTVVSTYTPQAASLGPQVQNFGKAISPETNFAYDTLINEGQVPYVFTTLRLLHGDRGFAIDSGADPPQLAVGERRVIKLSFQALKPTTVVDSLIFGDDCEEQSAALLGTGGAADFLVIDQHWSNEPLPPGPNGYVQSVMIENLSQVPITIDSAWWDDTLHFKPVDSFPFSVPPTTSQSGVEGEVQFRIAYFPGDHSIEAPDRTQAFWHSSTLDSSRDPQHGIRTDSLLGNAVAPSEYFVHDIDDTVSCAEPGDTLHLTFQIADTGMSSGTINRIYHTDTASFRNLLGVLSSGNTWNPENTAQVFAPGEVARVTLDYPVPVDTNLTAIDYLTAINAQGDTIGSRPIKVTVHVVYKAGEVQPPNVELPAVRYRQSGHASKSFTITNVTAAPLNIDSVALVPGGAYNASYSLTTGSALPDTLAPGSNMTVTISFNDSLSFDAVQSATVEIYSGSCRPLMAQVSDSVLVSGALAVGYDAMPILSCDESVNNVRIYNTQPGDSVETIIDTVVSARLANGTNFSIPTDIVGTTFGSGTFVTIPVTFIPDSQHSLKKYYDTLIVELRSSRSDTVLYQVDSAEAGSVLVTGYSQFAQPFSERSDEISVPVILSISTLGLPIVADSIGITGIKLTYVIPHPDLLIPRKPDPFTISPALAAAGWSAKVIGNPKGERADSMLTVMLTGSTPLSSAFDSAAYGNLNFEVALDKADDETAVTLQAIQLFTGPNGVNEAGTCIATATHSGDFSLILRCGDSTLKSMMRSSTMPLFIKAAIPNPVSGPEVTFDYANRGAGTVTLTIYDILGHEVARPVDNVPQEAGSWEVHYGVSNLPNGTYTYRLCETGLLGKTAISRQFAIQR